MAPSTNPTVSGGWIPATAGRSGRTSAGDSLIAYEGLSQVAEQHSGVTARAAPAPVAQAALTSPPAYRIGQTIAAGFWGTATTVTPAVAPLTLPAGAECSPAAALGAGVIPVAVRFGVAVRVAGCRAFAPTRAVLEALCQAPRAGAAVPRSLEWLLGVPSVVAAEAPSPSPRPVVATTNGTSTVSSATTDTPSPSLSELPAATPPRVADAVTAFTADAFGAFTSSVLGSSSSSDGWLRVNQTAPPSPVWDDVAGVCYNVTVGADVVLMVAMFGPQTAPQYGIVSAVRRWRTGTWTSTDTSTASASAAALIGQSSGVSQYVFAESSAQFHAAPTVRADILAKSPPLLPRLPRDVWFPFGRSASDEV